MLAGAGIGGLPVDGNTIGESDGVAELEGISPGASGVEAISGPSATGGAPIGLDTGALTGEETVGGGVATAGDGVGEEPPEDGLTAGGVAGDFAGETAGAVAGGVDTGGEAFGGEEAGDFDGDGE